MKAPSKFRITLAGTTTDILRRRNAGAKIGHYLETLVCGVELPDDVFKPWYLEVKTADAADLPEPMSIFTVARGGGYIEATCNHCGRKAVFAAEPIAEMARGPRVQSDLRDLGRQLRCHRERGGCGKRGATVQPIDRPSSK